ncbi:MAG TPA: pyridoxamine 5'-phosphate oxidase family protein [Actinomycetota bacterium]|jgi:nitroimidazol reductase NimA-like FMN-containing flavoprotein (pyridoxamine 5'-phosphate oxidase superfamily)|nr:pyridoxamine 5'-phosphate oxidase family protein [Actinomycetota bacterium]
MGKLDLSLTPQELNDYLTTQRIVRVATADESGEPHVVPLWFVWHDGAVFMNSTLGNLTVENMLRSGRATAVVDDGVEYDVLRGVTIHGTVRRADDDPRQPEVERLWSQKYMAGGEVPYRRWRGRTWLRIDPDSTTSWDFRKIPAAKAGRNAERAGGGA